VPLTGARALIEWLVVGLVTSAVVVWLAWSPAIERPNNLVYDGLMRLRGGQASEQVVVVAIDNRSIAALGRWPWPRQRHAELIGRLHAAGAKAVAYDVLFTEPSAGDDALARALAGAGNVYLPLMVDPVGDDGTSWQAAPPIPALARAAAGTGHVNLTADSDGVVRRLPLYLAAGDQVWPHMIVRLWQPGRPAPAPPRSDRLTGLEPTALSYRGPPGAFRTVSFVDLVRGETPAQFLVDRYVLVGMTADGLGDRYATPTSRAGELTPGVEVQASLLDTLIAGDAVRPLARGWLALLSLLPLWVLMAGFLLLRPALNMVAGAALIVLVFAASMAGFLAGHWLAPLAAVAGLALAYPLWSWRRLAAASAYMQAEIEAFEAAGASLPMGSAATAGDVVSRQVDTLRAALAAFRTADRQREEALQLLSHDMRAPQVSILTLLQSGHDRADPAFERRIADNAGRTLALAESYVQLARAESRQLATTRFDLSQALLDAADTLWPQAEARGVRVATRADPSEVLVDGDQGLLTRAVMNLIDNAIKYGPAGGVVDCDVAVEGASCVCTIRDQGPGLPAEVLDHLYEPFRRGAGGRTGAGLGLAFVRTVAERHGGSIRYERREDGAVFVLRLPLADED
jgi:CHASE2 domain-containing sensor protein/two-component sensor histidine kinase